jgi:hypothetical protein
MASVYLSSGDTFVLGSKAKVFGVAGAETLVINAGVTEATTDQNVDRVDLPGATTDFTYQQGGNNLKVYKAGVLIASIPLQDDADGSQIVFSNGSVSATLVGSLMTLGGTTVTTTVGAVVPATIDATVTSGSGGGTAAVPTFSVTAGADAAEGTSATFTVTLSSAVAGATTVNYALAGVGDAVLGTDTTTVANGTLNFAAGELTKTITVPVTLDALSPEAGEGVSVTLSAPSTGTAVAATPTAQVLFTDVPVSYSMTASATNVTEGVAITYTLTATAAATTDTTVAFSVVPGDTTATNQGTSNTNLNDFAEGAFNPANVVLLAGQKTATYTVTASADTITELPENYSVKAEIGGVIVATKTTSLLDGSAGGVGKTISLTTNTDSPGATSPSVDTLGTSGDDTYNAVLDAATATNNTYSGIDNLDGGDGIDTLSIIGNGNLSNTITPLFLKNVEKVSVNDVDVTAATTVNLANATGVTNVINNGSVGAVVFQNIGTAALTVQNVKTAVGTTFTRGASSVTADLTINLDTLGSAEAAGSVAAVQAAAINSVDTNNDAVNVTINAKGYVSVAAMEVTGFNGASHTAQTVTVDAAGTTIFNVAPGIGITGFDTTKAGKIVVKGAGAVALNTLAAAVKTVDASANTVGVTLVGTVYGGTEAAALATPGLAITGGSGNDSISVDGVASAVVNAGLGDDTVTLTTAHAANAKIGGGDGTADRIVLTSAMADALDAQTTDGTALRATLTGFEQIGVTGPLGANFNVSQAGSYNYLALLGDVDGVNSVAVDVSGFTSGATVEFRNAGDQTAALNVVMTGAAEATTDVVNLKLNANLANADNFDVRAGVTGINNVNIAANDGTNSVLDDDQLAANAKDNTADDGYTVFLTNATNVNNITITGSSLVNLTSANSGNSMNALKLVDASASTGNFTFSLAGFTGTERAEIKGSQGTNDITGDDATFGEKITGGAKADVINGGVGADDMTGNGGRDSFAFAVADSGRSSSTVDQITDFGKVTAAATIAEVAAMNTVANFQATATAKGGDNADVLDLTGGTIASDGTVLGSANVAGSTLIADLEGIDATSLEFTGKEINLSATKGLVTLSGADKALVDTLAEWVVVANKAAETANESVSFEFSGITYVFQQATPAGVADDFLVELTGVTGVTGVVLAGGGVAAAAGDIFII